MKKVLIPTKLDATAAQILTAKGFQVIQNADKDIAELAVEHSDAQVLIVRSEKVCAEIIDAMPQLKLVVRAGAGYNTIDTKHARRRGVDVMNTPGANSNAVAEEVVTLILAALRHVVPADASTRQGKWEKKKFMGGELTGKTIGIIGLGNIGRLLVKRLRGFDMRFLAYDPVISADLAGKMGVELMSVEEIFSQADFVSLHIPENDETRGMINRSLLRKMKSGAVLVNCARAGVINEDDLRAVKAEKGLVFCNDVYPKDAAGEKTVADIADVMLPHLGASTREANLNAAKRSAEQTIAYFEQGITNCVVNKGVPDGLDESFQNLAFVLSRLARKYLGENRAPHKIETSFYGELAKYGKWLISPIVAGIHPDFDIFQDAADAETFLRERGIDLQDRETDSAKNYRESMTIDLFEGDEVINKVSVRGTITESNLMISRINDFDKLYLEPSGHNLFLEYGDQPGVIGTVASILGKAGINIIDLRAPQDIKAKNALAVIKTSVPVDGGLLAEIKAGIQAKNAFSLSY